MTVVTVDSWDEAISALYEGSWNQDIDRFRSPFVFRGLDRVSYHLETTLQRLGANRQQWLPRLEHHLLRSFKKYAHRDVVERDSPWHWLTMAQHHGLATRLLDWTYSPFVGLHFATSNQQAFDVDGVVVMVDIVEAQNELPPHLLQVRQEMGSHSFDADMLAKHVQSLEDLATYPDQQTKDGFLLFFEPPSIDDRVVNQYALFSILSDPSEVLDKWLARRAHVFKKVIIPAAIKWEIRDKLDQSNINERVIFPGLDGLSKWLNRNYYPK